MLGWVGGRRASAPTPLVFPDEPTAVRLLGPVDPDTEPWARTHPQAVLVPLAALQAIARPADLAQAHRSPDRVELIASSIERAGLHQPLTVVHDARRIVLEDGHNRLVGTTRTHLPVCFEQVPRITGYGVPAGDFIQALAAERP